MNIRNNVSLTTRLLSAASAAALSLTLLAGAGAAQELGLKQLQDSATTSLAQLGMDTSVVDILTLDELTQVEAVTGAGESDATKIGRIETIIRGAEERIAAGGAVAPTGATGDVTPADLDSIMVVKETVAQELAQLGMTEQVDIDSLTDDQLMQIQLITSGTVDDNQVRQQIEEIVGN